VVVLVLSACNQRNHSNHRTTPEVPKEAKQLELKPLGTTHRGANIYIIGNCEYIYYYVMSDRAGFTHKGDCTNPIHCYNPQ